MDSGSTAPDGKPNTLLTEGGNAQDPVTKTEPATSDPATPQVPFDPAKLTWPEGFDKPDDGLLGKFGEIAKSANLSQDTAQQLAGLYSEALTAASEANVQAWKSTIESWENEVRSDPNLGGSKWAEAKANVARVLDDPRFATQGIREAMNLTGIGSNPAFVRFMVKVASALTEGKSVEGAPPGQQTQANPGPARALYPNLASGA